ncbi:4'-phosphopantetheinyl transferase superfamily protein, partial [Aestuariivirga sp.]|uniref:4'-phosphopantetheinyl transferase family protein n=1 Tax=Aestuariivirga sp. TaxID=2650926 RepID=UPI003016B501
AARLRDWMFKTPPAPESMSALNPEETARLRHYRQPADQWRLLLGRTILRLMLKEDHGIPAADIVLTAKGKPVLAERYCNRLDFSITHDGLWVAVGITTRGLIGIDLSETSNFRDWDAFVREYLDPAEIRQLRDLPAPETPCAAARLWTAKEGILKAAGYGLTLDPRGIILERVPALMIRQLPADLPALGFFHLEENGQLEACSLTIVSLYADPAIPAAADIRQLQVEALPGVQNGRYPFRSS